jgi:glutamate synthase domain-containing protein 1
MESKASEVKNVIEQLVHPREKKSSNIQELNHYQEITNVKKKPAKKKKLNAQKKKLSRNEMKNLGLYSLPRKTLIYKDYLALNELWTDYMQQQLGSDLELLKNRLNPVNASYEQLR